MRRAARRARPRRAPSAGRLRRRRPQRIQRDGPPTETIEITFDGDTVTPNGERVEVSRTRPSSWWSRPTQPGEIHVHSDPEQELEYSEGTTTLPLDPIDKPGVVDVESHDLDQIIVQLEVE